MLRGDIPAKEFLSFTIFPKRSAETVSEDILNLISRLFVLAKRHENSVENVFDAPDGPSNRIGTSLEI